MLYRGIWRPKQWIEYARGLSLFMSHSAYITIQTADSQIKDYLCNSVCTAEAFEDPNNEKKYARGWALFMSHSAYITIQHPIVYETQVYDTV